MKKTSLLLLVVLWIPDLQFEVSLFQAPLLLPTWPFMITLMNMLKYHDVQRKCILPYPCPLTFKVMATFSHV